MSAQILTNIVDEPGAQIRQLSQNPPYQQQLTAPSSTKPQTTTIDQPLTSSSSSTSEFSSDNETTSAAVRSSREVKTAEISEKPKEKLTAVANKSNFVNDSEKNSGVGVDKNNSGNVAESEDENSGRTDIQTIRYFNKNMIAYYGRECLCILILIVTTYATYQNIPPKVSMLMPPKPFFPKGSLVHDWPAGQLTISQSRVARSELSLVMFYAPWCAESQYARYSFEYVARMYYREVHFAAINCWQPGGECRHQYAKVMSWPVLMAYMQNGLAIPYNGKWTNEALSRFVRSLLEPVRRITSADHLLKLMMTQDAVVTAFLNMKLHSAHYRAFYRAAVKWLERDPFQEVRFTVVTGNASNDFGVVDLPTVRMYLWNETLEFPNTTWTHKQLNNWVANGMHQVSVWVAPPGSKSTTLASYLRTGPALMLFSPRNLNDEFVDAYIMLRQIALEYFNCPHISSTSVIREMARSYIPDERHLKWQEHQEFIGECESLHASHTKQSSQHGIDADLCRSDAEQRRSVSVTFANIVNSSNLSDGQFCLIGPKNIDDEYFDNDESCLNEAYYQPAGGGRCWASRKSIYEQVFRTSMLNNEFDTRSPENLQRIALKRRCEWASMTRNRKYFFFDSYNEPANFETIAGMACKSNQTISFLAIDSQLYHVFAERLGVDVLNAPNQTVALILDHENESTFLLDHPITTQNLAVFLGNFINKKLIRYLKDHPPNTLVHQHHNTFTNDAVNILEISSKNFEEKVLRLDKTVIVLFHSTQCALCSLMAQHLLHISSVLYALPNFEIVRIDGDRNDLPWPYTMEKYPSLVAFSGDRQSESRMFPSSLAVTVQNVLGFILANLNRPDRLQGLVLVCRSIQKQKPFTDCIRALRTEIVDSISFNLRQWRLQTHLRGTILRRLQSLQRFYLHLYRLERHSSDFREQSPLVDSFVRNIASVWMTKLIL